MRLRYNHLVLLGCVVCGLATAFLQSSVAVMWTITITGVVLFVARSFFQTPASEIDRKIRQSCEAMTQRMRLTVVKEINQEVEIAQVDVTDVAVEVSLLIGSGMLDAYEERAIIPFERVKDLKYWQDITRIIINNHRTRVAAPATPASPESFKIRKLSGNPNQLSR